MYSGKLQRTVPQASRPTVAPVQGRSPAVAYGAPPASQPPGFQARIDAAARFGHSLARLVGPPPPSAPVIQRMKDGEIEDGRYYLVRYQENQLTARLRGRKDGEYQLVVLGTNSVIRVSDPEDIIMPVRLGKSEKEPSREEQSGKKETRIKRTREDTEIEHPAKGPTACVIVENGVPEAIVSDELVDAYLADLRDDPQHHLQEGEGQAIAHAMGVTAHVMAQVAGPLIQSTNLRYGNGAYDDGTLLHIGGNHYIVLHQVGPGVPADFVDTDGNGYAEGEKTVADGNCLIDGLHLIRDNQHATPEQIDQARAVAADAGGHDREGVRQILAATITDIVQGEPPGGIGTLTQAYIDRDPNIESARDELRQRKEQTGVEEDREEPATPVTSDEEDGEGNVLMPQAPPLEEAENVKEEAPQPSSSSGSRELETAVTRYLLEVNRLGGAAAGKLPEHRLVLELWHARYGRAAPSARALAHWLEERETKAHDYFGSDTESEGESASSSEEDEAEPIWTDEDYGLLGELNRAIAGAKDHGDIETILRDERFQRFVVPQFRGIAYMTNRFSKAKRREHRRSSQAGKPVFADAVRPPEMSREEFYTRSHGKDSAVERRKSDLQKYLVEMRKPSPVVDPKRRIVNARRSGRIFPTRFHVLQSDYSQDYTKSAEKIAEHRQGGLSGTSEASASTSQPSFDEQVYSGIPFRSHPFLSTSDQPGHAVRYALGNKPIAAEKAFRLRPRWRRGGKPQHPYSGKVYTSLHPLRDYLAPTAPSSVWMGRAQGTLSIDNDISKEGESSFLAAIKANRVVGEQVIRWPSLEESKDESGSHGLSAEERRRLRKILQEHPPHSKEQKGMKSGKLGQQVERHYTDKVMNAANRAAVKRGQLLVYRNLEGGFSREPPIYKTPGASALERWERPATKKTEEKRLAAIREGKVKPGYLTEGFFHDWPSEELYAGLSDEEGGPVRVEDDDPFDYQPLKRGQPIPETGRFLARCDSILKETRRALAALPRQRNVSFASMRAAGTRLVERAYARIHREALAGWTQADLKDRHLALPPPAGAPGDLEAWFRQMIAALEAETEALAQSWGPGEEDLLE
ncbi:MAG TPA: hypothetical protein VGP73_15370 [Thermoanaerobaculia bacterium]